MDFFQKPATKFISPPLSDARQVSASHSKTDASFFWCTEGWKATLVLLFYIKHTPFLFFEYWPFFPSDSLPYFYASLTFGVPPERELKLISWLLAADFYFVLPPPSSTAATLIPSMHLEGKLNTQGPVVIKSSVSGLRSPAASLSTADTHRGWPILHYGLSEKESIAASRAVKSVWPPLGFPVRHQSQTEKERQTIQREKASASARRLSLCCRLLIGAMCSWQVLWWQ